MSEATRTDEALLVRVEAEYADLRERGLHRLTLEFEPMFLMSLVGQLQLALRHPRNTGPAAQTVRHWIYNVQRSFRAAGCPALAELIERGFDPEHDT